MMGPARIAAAFEVVEAEVVLQLAALPLGCHKSGARGQRHDDQLSRGVPQRTLLGPVTSKQRVEPPVVAHERMRTAAQACSETTVPSGDGGKERSRDALVRRAETPFRTGVEECAPNRQGADARRWRCCRRLALAGARPSTISIASRHVASV